MTAGGHVAERRGERDARLSHRAQVRRCGSSSGAIGSARQISISRSSERCARFIPLTSPDRAAASATPVSARGRSSSFRSLRTARNRCTRTVASLKPSAWLTSLVRLLGDMAEREHQPLPIGQLLDRRRDLSRALARHQPLFGARLLRDRFRRGRGCSAGRTSAATQRSRRARALRMSRHPFTRMRVNHTSNGYSSR